MFFLPVVDVYMVKRVTLCKFVECFLDVETRLRRGFLETKVILNAEINDFLLADGPLLLAGFDEIDFICDDHLG